MSEIARCCGALPRQQGERERTFASYCLYIYFFIFCNRETIAGERSLTFAFFGHLFPPGKQFIQPRGLRPVLVFTAARVGRRVQSRLFLSNAVQLYFAHREGLKQFTDSCASRAWRVTFYVAEGEPRKSDYISCLRLAVRFRQRPINRFVTDAASLVSPTKPAE